MSTPGAGAAPAPTARVLVYSDDSAVRQRIMLAIGRRPAPDVPRVEFVEASIGDEVVALADRGGLDVCVLDAEAWPTGGMGLCRQLKNEIRNCPLIAVVLARKDDRWLAAWSQADAALFHPLDPMTAADTVARLLRARAGLPVPR